MAIGAVPNKIIETQLSLMQCGIVIATPGKLGECMDKGWMELDELQFVVVDEMDKYFSVGQMQKFIINNKIINKLFRSSNLSIFSAS